MGRPLTSWSAEAVDPVDQHVGRRLRLRRALLGLSQERLGELLGVTFQQIQKYERGANRIGAGRLWRLAALLDVPVAWFFEGLAEAEGAPAGASGLAEPGVGFVFEPERRPVAPAAAPAVDRRETLELVRAFNAIADPVLRRRVYELIRAVSEASTALRSGERSSA